MNIIMWTTYSNDFVKVINLMLVHAGSETKVIRWCWYVPLPQTCIQFRALTKVEAIAEGGFGVIYRAKHREWGTVVYKELKSSIIADGSRFDNHILCCVRKL